MKSTENHFCAMNNYKYKGPTSIINLSRAGFCDRAQKQSRTLLAITDQGELIYIYVTKGQQ